MEAEIWYGELPTDVALTPHEVVEDASVEALLAKFSSEGKNCPIWFVLYSEGDEYTHYIAQPKAGSYEVCEVIDPAFMVSGAYTYQEVINGYVQDCVAGADYVHVESNPRKARKLFAKQNTSITRNWWLKQEAIGGYYSTRYEILLEMVFEEVEPKWQVFGEDTYYDGIVLANFSYGSIDEKGLIRINQEKLFAIARKAIDKFVARERAYDEVFEWNETAAMEEALRAIKKDKNSYRFFGMEAAIKICEKAILDYELAHPEI